MKVAALKDVCRITNGGTPKSGVDRFWHGGVAWLTPAEMGKRLTPYIGQTARTISREGLANSSAKLVPPSSVILSTRAPIGHLAINEAPMAFNQGCRGLTPDDKLDTKYLYYFLYFSREALDGLGTGTTFKELSSSNLANFQIPHPPLDEQRRIVAVLDKAFAGIATATANAQKNLTNARALFDRYLDQAFGELDGGWGARTIGDIAAIKGGKRVPKGYKLLNEPTPYPYISVADFSDEGSVEIKKIRYISGQIFNQIKRYIIRKEDLYVSIAGTVGKTGIVPPELDGASLTENACRLVFNKGVSNRFVYYFTLTSSFKNQAIEQTRTAAQPKLALSRLQQICLPIPPQDAQEKLIATFDDLAGMVRQMEAIYQRKLTALIELKQSLLQKAFAGELT